MKTSIVIETDSRYAYEVHTTLKVIFFCSGLKTIIGISPGKGYNNWQKQKHMSSGLMDNAKESW